ncbi:GMC oxidoreductase-domain-containing protein [Coprinopsis sp. MPI-PUGE-AT-0042]|nr:GMC oxidoreductase-domain-containing protein [Coprinopsis sp. MPI-PUGE-AT-0042]
MKNDQFSGHRPHIGPDPDKDTNEEFLEKVRATAGSFYHPCGVTPISSKSSKAGVLDPEFKLKGATGLRVIDAGIMPYVPTAHTQAAVYAIAEAASDIIKRDW